VAVVVADLLVPAAARAACLPLVVVLVLLPPAPSPRRLDVDGGGDAQSPTRESRRISCLIAAGRAGFDVMSRSKRRERVVTTTS
jgi:hypothetical protein